jgi:protein FAM32A
MPSDEYAPVIRGALKLKGSGPSGVTKKKKKKPKPAAESSEDKKSAIQKALEDEDASTSKEISERKAKGDDDAEDGSRDLEEKGNDGKTASERAFEEMRRKRVCFAFRVYF